MQGDRKDPVSIINRFLRQRNLLHVTLPVELLHSNRQEHSVSSTHLHPQVSENTNKVILHIQSTGHFTKAAATV